MKKASFRIRITSIFVFGAALCMGLTGCRNEAEITEIEAVTAEQTDAAVPESVLEQAKLLVFQKYEMIRENEEDFTYIDWRIERLEHVYTYEDIGGMTLEVYCLNYEFQSDIPENVDLKGGMAITKDGWVVPEYSNSTYLVFERKDEEPDFLTGMFENDCYPGDEVFTEDLKQLLEESRGSFSDSTKEAAENQDYYRDFTGCSKEEAESFARMVKKQILDRDWIALSESILYPIQIRSVTYESEEAFLAENWDTFWTDTFWQAIEEEDCAEMFGNSSGIMLGDGQIWFSGIKDENADAPLLKIIAIND